MRECERRAPRAQSTWKLYTAGSVGSQALVGIPRLRELRLALGGDACVWPFETGFESPKKRVAFAEVFPSLLPIEVRCGEVKDQVQVRELARWFEARDREGRLGRLFDGPEELTQEQRAAAKSEEGWILNWA